MSRRHSKHGGTATQRGHRFTRQLRQLEAIAWMAGVALLVAYGGTRYWHASAHDEQIAAFEAARLPVQNLQVLSASADPSLPDDAADWSAQRIERYRQAAGNHETPVALLRIPATGLVVPVFEGTGEPSLNRGAGRIEGTARLGESGNLGIAAHRDGFFRALKNVRVGDMIFVERMAAADVYRVVEIRIVDPDQVEVLHPTAVRSLTLVTCYPFYYVGPAPRRYVVRAQIVTDCSATGQERCDPLPRERRTPRSGALAAINAADTD